MRHACTCCAGASPLRWPLEVWACECGSKSLEDFVMDGAYALLVLSIGCMISFFFSDGCHMCHIDIVTDR